MLFPVYVKKATQKHLGRIQSLDSAGEKHDSVCDAIVLGLPSLGQALLPGFCFLSPPLAWSALLQ